jgi:ribonuclease HI
MPWLRANLRGKVVFARANAAGTFDATGGRVEIRYNAHDGRMYRAGTRNLTIVDGQLLPEDTCGPASEVAEKAKGGKKASAPAAPPLEVATADRIIAYTDGACSGNPGPAGLGVVVVLTTGRVERYEYLGQATNNVAELTAILRALEEIDRGTAAVIHTDSQYAIGVLQKGWKAKANAELIATLREELKAHRGIRLQYVKGHAGIPLNERADELARQAIRERRSGRMASAARTSSV